jgi:hypothetical protein
MAGQVVAETTLPGWQVGYGYLDGKLLSQYRDSTTYFFQQDHLGSTRLLTRMDQSVYDSMDYLPYGEIISGGNVWKACPEKLKNQKPGPCYDD